MTARAAKTLTWAAWGLTIALMAVGIVLIVLNAATLDATNSILYALLFFAGLLYGTVGGLIARRHPRNPIGWLFCLSALAFAAFPLTQEYAIRGIALSPGSLPLADWIGYAGDSLFPIMIGPLVLVFLLYPEGRPLSRIWRAPAWIITIATAVGFAADWLYPHSTTGNNDRFLTFHFRISNPIHIPALRAPMQLALTISAVMLPIVAIAAIVSLILRLRRSSGVERQQVRWLAYAGAAMVLLLPFLLVSAALSNNFLGGVFWFGFFTLLCAGVPVASGIAILKHRLYDLDVVVKKTVVFGALLAFGTLVYLAVVVGIGAAIGNRGNTALTLAAAAIVAIAFQPLRTRARHLADRLVYGKRATPYEVLSEFSDRMATSYSTDDVLPRMAQLLGEGTGAERAGVWLRVGSEARLAAAWPHGDRAATDAVVAIDDLDHLSGGDRTFPVRHRGELLGALTVAMPPTEPLTPSQEKLVGDLASQAGLVLRNVRLIEELRASRQRLVAAQDQERRRLERNLHDGAQQQLVALGVQLGLAQRLAAKDAPHMAELLQKLQGQTTDALDDLRDLARGIYPPLLADQGLAAALSAQARKASLPVEVDSDGIGRYPQEAEAAVYFCVLEALQNVAKYAGAAKARVRLGVQDHDLAFEVVDDGAGFDAERTPMGSGLQNMADRLAALGGSLEVRSQPGSGTTVIGRIPTSAPST